MSFNFAKHRNEFFVAIVMAAGMLFSFAIYRTMYISESKQDADTFASMVQISEESIRRRLDTYDHLLASSASFLRASDKVEYSEWNTFMDGIGVREKFPGLTNVNLVVPVKPANLPSFVQQNRKSLNGGFKIQRYPLWPDYQRPSKESSHYILTYIYPAERQKRLEGLDLSEEAARVKAIEQARDTGRPTLSSRVQIWNVEENRPSFIYFYPFYKNGADVSTVESRRKNFEGLVCVAIVMDEFIKEALGDYLGFVDLQVFEGINVSPAARVFTGFSTGPQFEQTSTFNIGDYPLLIGWKKGPKFPSSKYTQAIFLGVCGILFAACMTSILITIQTVGRKAEVLAAEKAKLFQESESKFTKLVESSPAGVLLLDARGRMLEVNAAFLAMTGYAKDEIETIRETHRWISEEGLKKVKNMVRFTSKGLPYTVNWEQEIATKDGGRRPALFAASLFSTSEEMVSVFVLDLTEKKAAEAVIEQQQLKIASAAKMSALGELASGLAHEINNPLAIINMSLHSLRIMIDPETQNINQARTVIDKIESTTMRVSKIIKGLKTFARDATFDAAEDVPVGSLFTDVNDLCAPTFRGEDTELKFPLNVTKDMMVTCRPVEIVQVLLNLINNAHDAVKNQPTKWVEIQLVEYDKEFHIRVSDSGPGIPQELREKIFAPFFTTKAAGVGTGLGLSISKSIAEKNGGRLLLDPKEKQTTFVLEIPKAAAAKAPAA